MHRDGKTFEVIDPVYADGRRVTVKLVGVPRPDEGTDLVQV